MIQEYSKKLKFSFSKKISSNYFFFLLVTFFLTGCPFPDVKDFSDATTLMSTSISNSARETLDILVESYENQKIEDDIFNFANQEKKDYSKEIREKWKTVDKTLSSLISYADALNSIAHAGQKGQESFNNVGNAIGGLASAAGIPAIPAAATEAGKFIYGEIAKIRAANSLKEVTTAADTSIQIIADIFLEDLDVLKRLNDAAKSILLKQHFTIEVDRYRNYHNSLVEKELNLIKKITLLNDYENGDPESLISFLYEDPITRDKIGLYDLSKEIEKFILDDNLEADQKIEKISRLHAHWDKEIKKILVKGKDENHSSIFSRYDINSSILEKIDIEGRLINMKNELAWNREEIIKFDQIIKEIDKKEADINAIAKTNEELIEKSKEVVEAWKIKHKQMANFFDKKQEISFNDIIGYASAINSTYQEFKENR